MRPELVAFVYSQDERTAISHALNQDKPWETTGPVIEAIKRRIKDFHLNLNGHVCCYCQRDLAGEFQMVIDVEHILPSSKFKGLTFEIWNLSSSCKRCNMLIKRDHIDFLNAIEPNFFKSEHYDFVHPNFDEVERYIVRLASQAGRRRLVKYFFEADTKGEYTYWYFHLDKLETDSFDEAQGAIKRDPLARAGLDMMRARVDSLLQKVGA